MNNWHSVINSVNCELSHRRYGKLDRLCAALSAALRVSGSLMQGTVERGLESDQPTTSLLLLYIFPFSECYLRWEISRLRNGQTDTLIHVYCTYLRSLYVITCFGLCIRGIPSRSKRATRSCGDNLTGSLLRPFALSSPSLQSTSDGELDASLVLFGPRRLGEDLEPRRRECNQL